MDASSLIPRLVSEFGYPAAGARVVADKLAATTPEIQAGFLTWWTTGRPPELEVAGYTVRRLVDEHGLNPIAAVLTLDWLSREPATALATIQRGYDRVIPARRGACGPPSAP